MSRTMDEWCELGLCFSGPAGSPERCLGCGGGDCDRCAKSRRIAPHRASRRLPSSGSRAVREPVRDLDLVYTFDDSLEGLLCAIFDAYARHENPGQVLSATGAQLGLLQREHVVATDEAHARRVHAGVVSRFGRATFNDVERVFLSDDPQRCTYVYRFLRHAFACGLRVRDELAHDDVAPFVRLSRAMANECERVRQFTRFREVEGGIFYARISPHGIVMPLVMDYFAARLGSRPFLIYDDIHELAGVWDGHAWGLRRAHGIAAPPDTADEREQARLWKTFYRSIAVEQRANEHLRRQLMPVRFWHNMTEFDPLR